MRNRANGEDIYIYTRNSKVEFVERVEQKKWRKERERESVCVCKESGDRLKKTKRDWREDRGSGREREIGKQRERYRYICLYIYIYDRERE